MANMLDIEARIKIENAMKLNYSDEQWDVVKDTGRPVGVISSAGSGKTTVLIARLLYKELVEEVKPYKMLVITFNRAATDDIKERYKKVRGILGLSNMYEPSFYTFHAFFLRLLRSIPKYEEFKVANQNSYIYQLTNLVDGYSRMLTRYDTVVDILNERSDGINNKKDYYRHNKYGDKGIEVINKYEDLLEENSEMDFDDMLLLLYRELFEHDNQEIQTMFRESYDLVLIDEFQDISGIQYDIVEKLIGLIGEDKLTIIGDDDQASLHGSRVLMADGSVKNVEDLEIGDKVKSYKLGEDHSLAKEGYKVLDKKDHKEDDAIEISTKMGKKSTYSKGHLDLVRLNKKSPLYMLYLVKNEEDTFIELRIKETIKKGRLNLEDDLKEDKVDYIWVLELADSKEELEDFVEFSGYENKLHEEYKRLIHSFGLSEFFPIAFKGEELRLNVFDSTTIRAINVLPKLFQKIVRDGNQVSYDEVKSKKKVKGNFSFTSLKIEGYKTYIADDMVTHNCIYEFRGSEPKYITQFGNMFPSARIHLLTVNYRCPQEIVSFVAPSIYKNEVRVDKELRTSTDGGEVLFLSAKDTGSVEYAIKEDYRLGKEVAILVRNNHQKTVIGDKLVRNNIPVDMGSTSYSLKNNQLFKRLTNFIDIIRESKSQGFVKYHWMFGVRKNSLQSIKNRYRSGEYFWVEDVLDLDMWNIPNQKKLMIERILNADTAKEMFELAMEQNLSMLESGSSKGFYNMEAVNSYYEYIMDILGDGQTYGQFISEVDRRERQLTRGLGYRNAVKLVTMHSVKGLEYETVVVYDPSDGEMFPEYRSYIEMYGNKNSQNNLMDKLLTYDEEALNYIKAEVNTGTTNINSRVTVEDVKSNIEAERRLFYVAVTRAKEKLIIATDKERRSSFVMEALRGRGEVEVPKVDIRDFEHHREDEYKDIIEQEKEVKVEVERLKERERREQEERREKGLNDLESILGISASEDKDEEDSEVSRVLSFDNLDSILGMGDE